MPPPPFTPPPYYLRTPPPPEVTSCLQPVSPPHPPLDVPQATGTAPLLPHPTTAIRRPIPPPRPPPGSPPPVSPLHRRWDLGPDCFVLEGAIAELRANDADKQSQGLSVVFDLIITQTRAQASHVLHPEFASRGNSLFLVASVQSELEIASPGM